MTGLLPLLLWLGLGAPAGVAFWRAGRRDLALAVAPFAGLLAILLPPVIAPWLGGDLRGWPWQAGVASTLIGVGCVLMLGSRSDAPQPASPPAASWATPLSLAALVAVAAVLLIAGEILAEGWPGYGWDGLAIWLVRARVLAESDVFPVALFSEPQLREGHWDYPLALPALLGWYARVGGLGLQQLVIPLVHIAAILPLATALSLYRLLGWPLAAAAGLAPLVVPELLEYHVRVYADPLLVMVVTAALAASVAGAICWDRGRLVIGGLAWAVAVSVKNEGFLWLCAAAAGSVLLSSYRALPRAVWAAGLARLLAPGFLAFGIWQLTCRRLEVEGTLMSGLRWDLVSDRFAPLIRAMLEHVFTLTSAPLLLACIAAIVFRLRGPLSNRLLDAVVLLSIPIAFVCGLFVIYLATPHDLSWHVSTSLHRTVYGVLPSVFVMALFAGLLGRESR